MKYNFFNKNLFKESFEDVKSKAVVFLVDKYEGKKVTELLEKFTKPVMECIGKPIEIKGKTRIRHIF